MLEKKIKSDLGFQDMSEFENGWTWQPALIDMSLKLPLWGIFEDVLKSLWKIFRQKEVHGSWCIFLRRGKGNIFPH